VTSITVRILIAVIDDQGIRVSATENHRIFNTTDSADNLIYDAVVPELVYMQMTVLFLCMKRCIDRSVGAYFFGPPCRHGMGIG